MCPIDDLRYRCIFLIILSKYRVVLKLTGMSTESLDDCKLFVDNCRKSNDIVTFDAILFWRDHNFSVDENRKSDYIVHFDSLLSYDDSWRRNRNFVCLEELPSTSVHVVQRAIKMQNSFEF